MFFSSATRQLASLFGRRDLTATSRMVFKYLKRGLAQTHVYVIGHHILGDNPILATETDWEIKQMTADDNDEIDELIAIDEWPISKSDTLKMLEKGQLCYVAKHQAHLVACTWVIITAEFEDYFLRRKLRLAPNEAYYWRTMTLPSFRGRGIVPYLTAHADADLVHRLGKTFGLGWVRTNNVSMLRALSKLGRMRVGRMGFFQILNIRFHYLWGTSAFKETRPRFKIQMMWPISWRVIFCFLCRGAAMVISRQFAKTFRMREIKRIHLFEFIDQTWFPKLFRGFVTDLLQHELTAFDVYAPIVPKIKEVMQKLNCRQIIDLCSGSTGPLLRIQEILSEQENYPVSVTLTDKFPNVSGFQRLCRLSKYPMSFVPIPVDATSVPSDYQGIRTLFTAFHHFRPDQARQILQDAANKHAPIGIFEFTERTVGKCLHMILHGPFIPLRMIHSLRPFKWNRFFWTYIVPVLPIVYTWDALVTRLRSYSIHELNQLVSEVKSDHYSWEIGQVKSEENGLNITYLLGYSNQKETINHAGLTAASKFSTGSDH